MSKDLPLHLADPFCPKHGRQSRPITCPNLPCDCSEDRKLEEIVRKYAYDTE